MNDTAPTPTHAPDGFTTGPGAACIARCTCGKTFTAVGDNPEPMALGLLAAHVAEHAA